MAERPEPPRGVHSECCGRSYEYVAVPEGPDWRLETGRRCAWKEGHPLRGCGAPSVATLRRSGGRRFGYCGSHLFGRWVEDGKVMHWMLREVPDA